MPGGDLVLKVSQPVIVQTNIVPMYILRHEMKKRTLGCIPIDIGFHTEWATSPETE